MKSLFSKEKWQQLFYTVSHPSDGFYWIRHGEKGSVAIAILMVVLFGLCFTLNRLLAGFVVNDINERTVNALWEMSGVLMLYLLLCVGNWSITCLMDGEGRLKDIAIAIGYSLLPMIVCYIAATIVSQFVAENEEAFYAIIIFLGTAYTLIMALIGIMQVHNYILRNLTQLLIISRKRQELTMQPAVESISTVLSWQIIWAMNSLIQQKQSVSMKLVSLMQS